MMPWRPINATGESFLPFPDSSPHPKWRLCIRVLQRIGRPKNDDLVKSPKAPHFVIPANPGSGPGQAPESSYFKQLSNLWTPIFIVVTSYYESTKYQSIYTH